MSRKSLDSLISVCLLLFLVCVEFLIFFPSMICHCTILLPLTKGKFAGGKKYLYGNINQIAKLAFAPNSVLELDDFCLLDHYQMI